MSKLSREKGKRFERATVNWLKSLGYKARRLAPMQAGSPEDYPDVRAWNECRVLEIECCHAKKVNWRRKFAQMLAQRRNGGMGLCRLKDDKCDPVWIVPESVMMELLR